MEYNVYIVRNEVYTEVLTMALSIYTKRNVKRQIVDNDYRNQFTETFCCAHLYTNKFIDTL